MTYSMFLFWNIWKKTSMQFWCMFKIRHTKDSFILSIWVEFFVYFWARPVSSPPKNPTWNDPVPTRLVHGPARLGWWFRNSASRQDLEVGTPWVWLMARVHLPAVSPMKRKESMIWTIHLHKNYVNQPFIFRVVVYPMISQRFIHPFGGFPAKFLKHQLCRSPDFGGNSSLAVFINNSDLLIIWF